MAKLFGFPNPVNEIAARTVAAGVAAQCVLILLLTPTLGHSWFWLTIPLAYGFLARVATGPTLSPLGQFATRIAAPRIGHAKFVPGPPKRFAQLIGALLSTGALACALGAGWDGAALVLVAMILVAALLEAVFAYCLGCVIFGALMRAGFIPREVCLECADVSARLSRDEVRAH
jgi:Domain of unknown function (DUF4395)